jgi:hypothetical protein
MSRIVPSRPTVMGLLESLPFFEFPKCKVAQCDENPSEGKMMRSGEFFKSGPCGLD